MNRRKLPYDVKESLIRCCGTCFHYLDEFRAFLTRCGVPGSLWERYCHLAKFKIARSILQELEDAGEGGLDIQYRLLVGFTELQRPPGRDLQDFDSAKAALIDLKNLAAPLLNDHFEDAGKIKARQQRQNSAIESIQAFNDSLSSLHTRFIQLFGSLDPQRRGYELELLLHDLFKLYGFEYVGSFRAPGEQIDGLFKYSGHHYLVEAKWTKGKTVADDIVIFREKVRKKFSGTRGLFVSVNGFAGETVTNTKSPQNPVLLADGSDLTAILENRISLTDAIERKLLAASMHGEMFHPLDP